MDHRTGQSQRNVEEQRAAVTESMAGVEERVQETIEGLKSTVHRAMESFKQLQETVDGGKSAVDEMLENVKGTVDEMVQHVKPTADLLDYGQQNPWLLMGCAILMGYILGSVTRENTFAR
jgi:ElaB/YqjD/DUF883 family membrane-anchored ribosome-binding protein